MLLGLVVITGFFFLPVNQRWLRRVVGYGNNFRFQRLQMNEVTRLQRMFVNEFILSKKIADSLRSKTNEKNALVLIPPASYFKENGIHYPVPEPAVFYYFTGIKTTWIKSNQAKNATWLVSHRNGGIILLPVQHSKALEDSILYFSKYNTTF